MCVDKNDSALHQGFGTDQLVIGGVVRNIQDTDLTCANLSPPGEVSRVELEGTGLDASSSATHLMNTRLADLCHGRGATQLELSLLTKLSTTTAGLATLVCSFTRDTLLFERGEWQL